MLYALPPAGDPVQLRPASGPGLERLCAPYRPVYYGSGTAALAAAVQAAVSRREARAPEVLLPAYGCPDLVSAVLHAGARPVLVDLEPERPWLDLGELEARLTEQTVAVIAVHLFGIPERLAELRAVIRAAGALLIEDSAQALPGEPGREPQGDYVIVSFGRGKPVSLLGGGAALAAGAELAAALPEPQRTDEGNLGVRLKGRLYNALRQPYCYWLPQALPGLGLGQTRFKPLPAIDAMDPTRQALLAANLEAYRRRSNQVQQGLGQLLERLGSERLRGLAPLCGVPAQARLLRYPLLCDGPELRERLLAALTAAGLGASRMYPGSLPEIAGVAPHLHRGGDYPQAQRLAQRLLTLPTHSGVRPRDIGRIECILRNELMGGGASTATLPISTTEG